MRKFGLAAILTFVDKGATAAMGRVGRRAAMLKAQFAGVGRGLGQMRAGMGTLATAALPVTAGLGLMIKKGADFVQSIAKLRAVTLDKFDPALKGLAKTLGATTAFSASQAADAMTNLGRAGLDSKQIMGAIRGTLNAAAAEGIGLAEAADMVASNIKAFNMNASEASKIAGILALTSARTNTSMSALQEGLKLAAPAVKPLNVSLADTSALLGALANIGLKGTLGGTAIRASVSKLLKPTSDAKKAMAELGVSLTEIRGRMDKGDLIGLFKKLVGGMKEIPKASKRAELMSRILGIRGQTMAAAMNMSKSAMDDFGKTLKEIQKESGETARRMKEIQLGTLTGQLTILKSAFEGVSIEIFDLISGKTRGLVERMAGSLGNLALAMRVVSGEKITDKKTLKLIEKIPKSFFEVARGIREAFGEVKDVFKAVGKSLGKLGKMFGLTGDGSAKSMAKIITKVTVLTAAFAPLALVVGGIGRIFFGFGGIIMGAGRTILSLVGGLGSLVRLFGALRWSIMGPVAALGFLAVKFVNFKKIWEGFKTSGVFIALSDLWKTVKGLTHSVGQLLGALTGVKTSGEGWKEFGRIVGGTLSAILAVVNKVVAGYRALIDMAKETMDVVSNLSRGKLTFRPVFKEFKNKSFATGLEFKPKEAGGGATPAVAAPTRKVRPAKDALVSTTGLLPVSAGDVVLDRASLAGAVVSQLRGGLAGRAGGGALGGGDPGRTSPAPAPAASQVRIEVPVEIDGRQVALAVAEVRLDEMERGGSSMKPGARRGFFERGLVGSES